MKRLPYRHGDLWFIPVEKGLKLGKKQKRIIVAEGEATGHVHELVAGEGGSVSMDIDQNGMTYVTVIEKPAALTHQEHGKLVLKPGTYKMNNEREHDYFLGYARNVID